MVVIYSTVMTVRRFTHPIRAIVSLTFWVASLQLAQPNAAAQDYGSLMAREVRRVLGDKDLRGYQFLSYPTNNFGIMTMYVLDKPSDNPKAANQWCATFTCLGLKGKEPTDPSAVKNVNGYADIGGGGPITLTDEQKRSLSVSALLPKILQVLDVGGNVDLSRDVIPTLSLGPATLRFLVKQTALDYLRSLPSSSEIKKAFDQNRLAIVIADVVIDSIDVSLKVNKSSNAGLNAQLSGKVNQVFGSGDQLQVKVAGSSDGNYTLKVTEPVVIARLTVKKPFGTTRGGDLPTRGAPDLNAWNRDWGLTQFVNVTKP